MAASPWGCAQRGALTLLMAACLMPGCGGTADETSTTGSAATTEAAGIAAVDPCTLVTTAEAEKALGAAVGGPERPSEANIPPRLVTCRYVAQKGQALAVMTVMVRQSGSASEARIGFQAARDGLPGAEPVTGLGDEAFWFANQLNLLRGTTYLNITGDFDRSTAQALAQTALQRLP